MTMPFVAPSGFNQFVPAANGLIVAAIRDPSSYSVNKYIKLTDATKPVFVWYKLHFDDLGQRGLTSDPFNEGLWVDGHDAPENNQNLIRHTTVEAQCARRQWDFRIGWQAITHSDLKTLMSHTLMVQNQAMMNITKRVASILVDPANWPDSNKADVSDLNEGAGTWDQSSSTPGDPNYLAIKKSIENAVETIRLMTNGAFKLDENTLRLILSPNAARKMSQSPEIHDYLKGSPDAAKVIKDTLGSFSLPKTLYGVELVIETTGGVAGHPKADGSAKARGVTGRSYVWPDNHAVLVSRPGGLDGQIGPSFSTVERFYLEKEMAVEVEDFKWDRLTKGRAVINDVVKMVCPESGFLLQNILPS